MKRVKIISIVLAVIFIAGLLPACVTVREEPSEDSGQKQTGTTTGKPTAIEEKIPNFNPAGFPIVNEKIKLTMLAIQPSTMIDDWSKHNFFVRMEKLTNISFDFQNVAVEQFNERKQLAWASGDLPDLFFKAVITTEEEMIRGEEGLLRPLNDLIEKYAPNIQYMFKERPDAKIAVTQPNGKIITLPYASDKNIHPAWYINVKWLDVLGLEMPENPDELYNALKMIKEGDPNQNGANDEVPMAVQNLTRQVREFMQYYGLAVDPSGFQYVDIDTDEVKYGPIQPAFKETLLFFRRIYADGLLDREAIEKGSNRIKELGYNNQLGLARMDASWVYVGTENELNMDYEVLIPFKVNGRRIQLGSSGISRGNTAISSTNKYPEATMRWLDYLYSYEGAILLRYGEENVDWKWRDDGTWESILKEGETGAQKNAYNSIQPGGQLSWWPSHPRFAEFRNKCYSETKDNYNLMVERLMPYYYEPYPLVYMSSEDTKEINEIRGTINAYVNDMMAKFIKGEASIEAEWDNYVATIHQMGCERLVELYSKAYRALVK